MFYWTKQMEQEYCRAWEQAPKKSSLFENDNFSEGQHFDGPTQAEMSAEMDELERLPLNLWLKLGEPQSSDLHRLYVSDTKLSYEFLVQPDDCRIILLRFVDPRIKK